MNNLDISLIFREMKIKFQYRLGFVMLCMTILFGVIAGYSHATPIQDRDIENGSIGQLANEDMTINERETAPGFSIFVTKTNSLPGNIWEKDNNSPMSYSSETPFLQSNKKRESYLTETSYKAGMMFRSEFVAGQHPEPARMIILGLSLIGFAKFGKRLKT